MFPFTILPASSVMISGSGMLSRTESRYSLETVVSARPRLSLLKLTATSPSSSREITGTEKL